MEDYNIRYATFDDIPAIKRFINNSWKKDHVLAREENLFAWQYTSNKLDYVIATDINGNIQGMLGFISYSDDDDRDIATSMWKANPGTGFLGIKILMFIQNNEKHRTLFSPGINVKTSEGIYKRMQLSTGKMNQWYRLNDQTEYKIAKIVEKHVPKCDKRSNCTVIEYETYERFLVDFNHTKYVSKDMVPYKSLEYINRRYFKHPSYEYMVYGIKPDRTETTAVMVLRLQECKDTCVLRFVDCIGDVNAISDVTSFLDSLLVQYNAEYIDMYEKGVSDAILRENGWTLLSETNNIIPNYFSPYEQCNVDVNYCTTDTSIILFRGDGDQDRPN